MIRLFFVATSKSDEAMTNDADERHYPLKYVMLNSFQHLTAFRRYKVRPWNAVTACEASSG
jgi:isopentenyldiphosphate isomerase